MNDTKERSKKTKKNIQQTKQTKTKQKTKENIPKKKKKKIQIHFSYYFRLITLLIIICILLGTSLLLIEKSIVVIKEQKVSYTEKSNLDYKVYLKENDFYESEYLGKNMSYIASLIDSINLSFNYDFFIDKEIQANFTYKIIGVLSINNEDASSTYFSKEYTLLNTKTKTIPNGQIANIHEDIKIDYDYYNQIANSFKQTYGISTTSNLKVYLKIDRKVESPIFENQELDDNNSMLINIPLSQKAISIKMDYAEINNNDSILSNGKISINNMLYLSLGIAMFVINIILIIQLFKKITLLSDTPNNYDKYIKRILKEYDRLIVITHTLPDFEKFNIFKIKDFGELLDARDNTKKPIMYYNVTDHIKCYFYIKEENDIYLLCIKAVDMEKKDKT